MAYVTASEFVYIPATNEGTTVVAEPEFGDPFPDGYGGFGAPHCACGELLINCGLCDQDTQSWLDLPCEQCGDANAVCLCALPF